MFDVYISDDNRITITTRRVTGKIIFNRIVVAYKPPRHTSSHTTYIHTDTSGQMSSVAVAEEM